MKFPYFIYKEHSSLEYGLYITEKGSYYGASRDVSFMSVPGRDGDLMTDNGHYNNIVIPYKTVLVNRDYDFTELSRLIKGWLLAESGYFKLWDTYDPLYFRYAAFTGEANLERDSRDTGSLSLSFTCKPYKYALRGQETVTLTEPGSLYNAELFASKPYIKITGSGTVTLAVNAASFLITGIEDYIEIDSEIMNVYKGAAQKNSSMTGAAFPSFAPGDNVIGWTGNVSRVDIIPRWCSL